MSNYTPPQKPSLQEQQDAFRTKTFRMMIHVALIFGIPAAIAALVGPRIDAGLGGGKNWTIVLLIVAFVISWSLTILLYKKLNREARALDDKVRESKEANSIDKQTR